MNSKFYFPGGNTTEGFFSYYNEITNHNEADCIYTIKGGPGVGKSTLMKQIAKKFSDLGCNVTYYHCSSDPDSLDGIKIEEFRLLFVDGTAPHIIDPKFPGCVENIICLSDFFNTKNLISHKKEIIITTKEVTDNFNISYKYLKSVKPLYDNLNEMYLKALNRDKFISSAKGLSREIINGKTGKGFKEKKLFLSAITPKGTVNFLNKTISSSTVYILNSHPGDLTHIFLNKLKYELERCSFLCESFYCPISPKDKLEHIYIPELDVSVVTSNRYHKFENNGINIDTSEFYFEEKLNMEIIGNDTELSDILIKKAVYYIKKAKRTHDILEGHYKNAMDFDKLNNFTTSFINKLENEFINKS